MPGPNHTSRVTGQEAVINVAGNNEIAVTNVSFDIEVNTTDVQTNQGQKAKIATTGLRYSGSFEYDGEQDTIRNLLFYSASDTAVQNGTYEAGEPKRVNMTVKEEDPNADNVSGDSSGNLSRTWTLENITVTGMSRDVPADDVASTSWDFEAEDAYVSGGGAADTGSRST